MGSKPTPCFKRLREKSLGEFEINRLTGIFNQHLNDASKSREGDLRDAQDMIKDAKKYCVAILIGMTFIPFLSEVTAAIGAYFLLTMALGTFKKYKSRLETRKRADVLSVLQMDATGYAMANFKGVFRDIEIESISIWRVIWIYKAVAFVYVGLVLVLGGALYFDAPTLADAKKAVTVVVQAVK